MSPGGQLQRPNRGILVVWPERALVVFLLAVCATPDHAANQDPPIHAASACRHTPGLARTMAS